MKPRWKLWSFENILTTKRTQHEYLQQKTERLYGSIFCLLINSKYSPNWFLCWKLYNVMYHTEFRHNSWKHYNHEYFNALMVFYTWFMKYEIDILIKNLIYWSWWHFVLLRLHNFRFIRAQYDQDKNHHSSFLVMHQWV